LLVAATRDLCQSDQRSDRHAADGLLCFGADQGDIKKGGCRLIQGRKTTVGAAAYSAGVHMYTSLSLIQGVSGGIVNILGGGSMDCYE
jgi:hypothetical protein